MGTLKWSDTYTGAYGRKLVPHYSVASTRYPGGSILKATNQDGTPYNPSGKNADGIYRVDDTGSSATYDKVDFYSDSDNYDKYQEQQSIRRSDIFIIKRHRNKRRTIQVSTK